MPVQFEIDKARGLILSVGTGVIDDADALATHSALKVHPDFDPDFDQVIDYRAVTNMATTRVSCEAIAEEHLWGEGSRRVFIAPSDGAYAQSRQYELRTADKPGRIRVFRTVEEALGWLADPAPGDGVVAVHAES